MYKYYLIALFIFSGCTNITFNAAMCDKIASEPNSVIPQECRNYIEEEAQKAFDNTKHNQESRDADIVEFNKE